ncbi:UNKNOWN [Stylonychia lemnae]|uniref:EF-hand domain-containing protein n=1 Tax=Stylonychia lemnae TaxID=5949 RepID=A0A077ZRU8_STYLE|nr:UNKNOWN [Stylonychia lemnae]|eukprot:CDW72638.1 UNKNOWN [Stylonychia lemnae]
MKPLLILKVDLGVENGGVIPLKIFQNDENYFQRIINSFIELFPSTSKNPQIKQVLFDQIKQGVQEAILRKQQRKIQREQEKLMAMEQKTFDSIMKNEEDKLAYNTFNKQPHYPSTFQQEKANDIMNNSRSSFDHQSGFHHKTYSITAKNAQFSPVRSNYEQDCINIDLLQNHGTFKPTCYPYIKNLDSNSNSNPYSHQTRHKYSSSYSTTNQLNVQKAERGDNQNFNPFKLNNKQFYESDTEEDSDADFISVGCQRNQFQGQFLSSDYNSMEIRSEQNQNGILYSGKSMGIPNSYLESKIETQLQSPISYQTLSNDTGHQVDLKMNTMNILDSKSYSGVTSQQTASHKNSPSEYQRKSFNSYSYLNFNKKIRQKNKNKSMKMQSNSCFIKRDNSKSQERSKVNLEESSNRLFNHSRQIEQKIKNKRDMLQFEQRMKENQNLTFKPRINKKSQELATQRVKFDPSNITNQTIQFYNSPDRGDQLNTQQDLTSRSPDYRSQERQQVHKQETFRPIITKRSTKLVEEKRKQSSDRSPVFLHLYQDAFQKEQKLKERQLQKQERINRSPFNQSKFTSQKDSRNQTVSSPNNDCLTEQSNTIMNTYQDQRQKSNNQRQIDHASKLIQYKEQLEHQNHLKRIHQKYISENFDENGQQLFKPRITRGPKSNKDTEFREKLDICTRMYYYMYAQLEKQKEVQEKELQKLRDQANQKWINDESKKLFQRLQLRKLRELFDMIDNDQDGEISENSFVQAQLSPQLQAVLRPLIKQCKKLDFNEFLEQLQIILSKRGEPLTQCLFQASKKTVSAHKNATFRQKTTSKSLIDQM